MPPFSRKRSHRRIQMRSNTVSCDDMRKEKEKEDNLIKAKSMIDEHFERLKRDPKLMEEARKRAKLTFMLGTIVNYKMTYPDRHISVITPDPKNRVSPDVIDKHLDGFEPLFDKDKAHIQKDVREIAYRGLCSNPTSSSKQ